MNIINIREMLKMKIQKNESILNRLSLLSHQITSLLGILFR